MDRPDAPDPTAWGLHGSIHRACPHARCLMHVHSTHAQDGLCAQSIRLPRTLDRGRFLEAVGRIPAAIFRIKGIIDLSDPPQTMLFQYVAGRYELSAFPHVQTCDRFLTVIGKDENPGIFKRVEELIRAAEA
jgi:G3E family GTPase